jgi:hypothetical protein
MNLPLIFLFLFLVLPLFIFSYLAVSSKKDNNQIVESQYIALIYLFSSFIWVALTFAGNNLIYLIASISLFINYILWRRDKNGILERTRTALIKELS